MYPVGLFIICCALQGLIALTLGPVMLDVLKLQLTFDPNRARAILEQWSLDDLHRLSSHLYIDMIYPFLYAAMLRRQTFALLPDSPLQLVLVWAATIGAAFDVLENFLLWHAMPDPIDAPDWLLRSLGFFGILRWIVMTPTVILLMPYSPLMARVGPLTIPFAPVRRAPSPSHDD